MTEVPHVSGILPPPESPDPSSLARGPGATKMLLPLLENLGNSPEEVASALRQHGVKGVRNTVRFLNPIVRFVRAQPSLETVDCDVILGNILRMRFPGGSEEHVTVPRPILDFLKLFNSGGFADLELTVDEAGQAGS
jgi:hypothetical protein